jgi:anti-anti-sigma factor
MPDRSQPPTVVVKLAGDLDSSRRSDLNAILEPATFADVAVIDLSGATYLDSTLLSAIALLRKNMKGCGSPATIRIAGASAFARRLFTITGLDKVVEFFDSVSAARVTPTNAIAMYALMYE